MQNVDDMIIKNDVIEHINKKTMEKSLQPRRTQVRGECYVFKGNDKKNNLEYPENFMLNIDSLNSRNLTSAEGFSLPNEIISGNLHLEDLPNRRKKKIEDAKKVLLTVAAFIGITAGVGVLGTMEYTDEIRQEINSMHTKLNPVGGKYEQEYNYDEGFVDYVGDLNNFELYGLYNEAKDTMDSSEKGDMEEVVEEMEENYLEGKGRGK